MDFFVAGFVNGPKTLDFRTHIIRGDIKDACYS